MKITYLKTIGFRKFEDVFETDLYPVTEITGGNTKGKTNILYAIVWAFLGTNLTGDDKVWLGNKNSDNCFVELHFEDNLGHTHTLARYKNKYNNSKINFHINTKGQIALAENILDALYDKIFVDSKEDIEFIGKFEISDCGIQGVIDDLLIDRECLYHNRKNLSGYSALRHEQIITENEREIEVLQKVLKKKR